MKYQRLVFSVSLFCAVFYITGTILKAAESKKTTEIPAYNDLSAAVTGQIPLTEEELLWLKAHPVITVTQDPGWPPVEFTDAQNNPVGISNDYLRLIEKRLGIKFQIIRNLSWQESYAALKVWDIDMTTSVSQTPERKEFWVFTKPYMNIPIVIITHVDVTYIANMHELEGKKIAVVDGYVAGEWMKRDYPKIQLIKVKNVKEGLGLLQDNKVFGLIDNMLVTGYYLTTLKISNLKVAGETPYVNAQCMAVRKDWDVFAGILQKALDSISERDRVKIYNRWVPIRYEHGVDYAFLWQISVAFALIVGGLVIWNKKLSREIKYRKHIQTKLHKSEEWHRAILQAAMDGFWMADTEGRLQEVNDTYCHMSGYSREELLQLKIADIEGLESDEDAARHIQRVMEQGEERFETVHLRKDGSAFDAEISAQFKSLDEGGLIVFVRDITERKRVEEELRLKNLVFEKALSANVIMDCVGALQYVNPAFMHMWGYNDKKQISDKLFSDLLASPQEAEKIFESLQRSGRWEGEFSGLKADGSYFSAYSLATLVTDGAHKTVGYQSSILDITERKQVEARLQQREKMDAIGQLAGGIAHDFNNQLGGIIGYAEMLANMLKEQTPKNYAKEIIAAAERSAGLTAQLLAFGRKGKNFSVASDIHKIIKEAAEFLRRGIDKRIKIILRLDSSEHIIQGDPTQLQNAILNLGLNARDAMPNGGEIIFATKTAELAESEVLSDLPSGNYLQLSITDCGSGMDATTQKKLFEPFFTTKEIGKGTGLGLASVYGTVKNHGGTIRVYSELGRGSTFNLYLPLLDSATSALDKIELPAETLTGEGHLLLVEDESVMLDMGVLLLRQLGYKVEAYADPADALAQYQKAWKDYDLVIIDMVMPRLNGRELFLKMQKINPELKVILSSGYSINGEAQRILDSGVLAFIQKPFRIRELAETIRTVLKS